MEKKMDNEMEIGIIMGNIEVILELHSSSALCLGFRPGFQVWASDLPS